MCFVRQDKLNPQTETLLKRNLIPRGRITTHLSTLFVFLVVSYAAIWYFWPTTYLANLPYCVSDLFLDAAPANEQPAALDGVYISPRAGARMDNFSPSLTHLLRFNKNGQVMYTIQGGSLDWRGIARWFNWDTTTSRAYTGRYVIVKDQIRITLGKAFTGRDMEWQGRIIAGELRFESNEQLIANAFSGTNTVVFKPYNVEKCPLTTPPCAERSRSECTADIIAP